MPTAVVDPLGLLDTREKRRPGRLYRYGSKAALMDTLTSVPRIDPQEMSATFTISTPTPDRSDDVVVPEGFRLENYAKNPVVYYDHGFSGIQMPIAKSEDDGGNLTVIVTPAGVEATAYFSQSLLEAAQVFTLIEEKIIRAASVRIEPLEASIRSDGNGFRPGLQIDECELIEWGPVGIPDNPEAVRKILDRGKLAGKPICEPLLKSLTPFAAPLRKHGKGWIPEGKTVAKNKTKAVPEEEPEESPTDEAPVDETPAEPPEEEELDKADDGPPAEMPLGAQVMSATIASMRQLSQTVLAACGPMENERVKEALTAMADETEGRVGELEAMYAKEYPDFKMESPDEEMPMDEDEMPMRKFLASGRQAQLRVSGIAAKLTKLGLSKALKQGERDEVNRMAGVLKGLVDQAKQAKPVEEGLVIPKEVLERLQTLEKRIGGAADKLEAAIPATRR